MTNLKLTLLAAAATLAVSIGGASAMPLDNLQGDSLVQNARLVCDQFGRCYDTRRSSRTRYYAPDPYGYSSRYDRRYSQPGVSVGVGPFGVWVR